MYIGDAITSSLFVFNCSRLGAEVHTVSPYNHYYRRELIIYTSSVALTATNALEYASAITFIGALAEQPCQNYRIGGPTVRASQTIRNEYEQWHDLRERGGFSETVPCGVRESPVRASTSLGFSQLSLTATEAHIYDRKPTKTPIRAACNS